MSKPTEGKAQHRVTKQDYLTKHRDVKLHDMAQKIGPQDGRPDLFQQSLNKGRSQFSLKNQTTMNNAAPDSF